MAFIVPPGGFSAFAQMTPASRAALGGNTRTARPGRRRRRKGSTSKRTRSAGRVRAGGKRKSRMKFGSPAWQKKYKVGKFRK